MVFFMRYPPKVSHINAFVFEMGSEDMARTLNRRATTSINSPEQRQPFLYYIREAVRASCHDFEESAKNHNGSTDCSPLSHRRRMRSDPSAEIDRTAGRKPHLDSDQNPDLGLPDLRRKSVHPLPPHC